MGLEVDHWQYLLAGVSEPLDQNFWNWYIAQLSDTASVAHER